MERLFESKVDYTHCLQHRATFTPFIPTVGTVCTFLSSPVPNGLLVEEVDVKDIMGNQLAFDINDWREITELPSIEEVKEMMDECELVEL